MKIAWFGFLAGFGLIAISQSAHSEDCSRYHTQPACDDAIGCAWRAMAVSSNPSHGICYTYDPVARTLFPKLLEGFIEKPAEGKMRTQRHPD